LKVLLQQILPLDGKGIQRVCGHKILDTFRLEARQQEPKPIRMEHAHPFVVTPLD